jgi:hypothetical protein
MQIFEENLPKYASSMDWVEHFLRLAKKLLAASGPKITILQKEFEFAAGGIYQ